MLRILTRSDSWPARPALLCLTIGWYSGSFGIACAAAVVHYHVGRPRLACIAGAGLSAASAAASTLRSRATISVRVRRRHAPHRIAHIVRDEQCTVPILGYSYRRAIQL